MAELKSMCPLDMHDLLGNTSAKLAGTVVPDLCNNDDQRCSLDAPFDASVHTLSLGCIDAGARVEMLSLATKSTVSTTSCGLVNALINVPDFRCGVFNELGATAASMLKQMCNIQMTEMEMERYFNPVKDLVYMKEFISSLKALGYTPNLIGVDTFSLLSRIREPIRCWKKKDNAKTRLTFWLVVNTNGIRTLHGQRKLVDALFLLASKGIWNDIIYNTLEITFDTEYPFRLIIYISDWNKPDMRLGVTESNPVPILESRTAFKNEPEEVVNWRFLTIKDDAAPSTGVIDLISDPFIAKKIIVTDCNAISWLQQMFRIVETGSSADLENINYHVVKFEIGNTEGAVFSMDAKPL